MIKPESIAEDIISLYELKGKDTYFGEAITQLEHACQTAQLAEQFSGDEELILAAFLHDLGHLIETKKTLRFGNIQHETDGSEYLKQFGFSQKIITLVKSHVDTKRYLCYTSKGYYDSLSEASKATLIFQGGPMSETEAKAFEIHPLKILMIKMRTWDEMAKQKNKPIPDLNRYKEMIIQHLTIKTIQE